MTKVSIKNIVFVICFIIVFLLQDFLLKPIIKENYLSEDLKKFKEFSWKYTVSIFIVFFLIILLMIRKNLKISQTPSIILFLIIFGFGFYLGVHSSLDNLLLYLNLKTKKREIVQTYQVISNKEPQVFWLDGKEPIHDRKDLEKINNQRIRNNLKSIFDYQNSDTVKVKYYKGIIDLNYIE